MHAAQQGSSAQGKGQERVWLCRAPMLFLASLGSFDKVCCCSARIFLGQMGPIPTDPSTLSAAVGAGCATRPTRCRVRNKAY